MPKTALILYLPQGGAMLLAILWFSFVAAICVLAHV